MPRIRSEMETKKGEALLKSIIEADKTYIGGKPHKPDKREDDKPAKHGRGTDKAAIIGAVQRGGKIVHYQTGYTPLSVAEACYKYNERDIDSIFCKFLKESVRT